MAYDPDNHAKEVPCYPASSLQKQALGMQTMLGDQNCHPQNESTMKSGATYNGNDDVDDDKHNRPKCCHPSHFLPPHLLSHLPCISLESKGFALQVVCFVHQQLNPFSALKHLRHKCSSVRILIKIDSSCSGNSLGCICRTNLHCMSGGLSLATVKVRCIYVSIGLHATRSGKLAMHSVAPSQCFPP